MLHSVVVISERFWREHLSADPNVLGKTLTLNGNSLAVIGVIPAGFTGLLVGIAPDFWAPMMLVAQMSHDPEALVRRGGYWLIGVGRLKPGIPSTQAQADLLVLSRQLQRAYPKFNKETESALFPATLLPVPFRGYVVAFTGLLMAVVALVLLIACAGSKLDLVGRLKDGTQAGGYSRSRLRSSLVVAQLAICALLLIGAGLCLRSLFNARSIDAGFEIDNRLAATLGLSSLGYAESKGKVFFSTLVERTETLPEVQSASLASYLPLESTRHGIGVTIEGYAPPAGQDAIHLQVTDIGPHYFRTMGTPLLRGREFTRQDDESAPRVAIINEAMAKRYWPGRDPLGRRLSIENESYEIVGVVKTGKYRTLGEAVVGIAGVIAYAVRQRTHEIGIRMALGAQQNEVLRMVVKQGAFLTLMGILIGLTISFALTRALSSLLYGIGSTDPLTFAGVSVLLSAVALLASYLPARRSTRVDPVIALRYE